MVRKERKKRKMIGKQAETWSREADPWTVTGVHHIKVEDDHTRGIANPLHGDLCGSLWPDVIELVHGNRPVSQLVAMLLQLRPSADSSYPDVSRLLKVNAAASPSSPKSGAMAQLAPQVLVARVKVRVEVDDRDRLPTVLVPGSSQETPGQSVVSPDGDHLLGGVPQHLGVDVDLADSCDQVKGGWRTVSSIEDLHRAKLFVNPGCIVVVTVGQEHLGHLSDLLRAKPQTRSVRGASVKGAAVKDAVSRWPIKDILKF